MRYLKGSSETCLTFTAGGLKLEGFVDADLAGDVDSRKSTTGYVYTLGGTAVSWNSTLQKIVALSTTEAEYVAVSESAKEIVWLQSFLKELGKMNGKVCGSKNPADMLTKGVTLDKLKLCKTSVGLQG